MASESDFLLAIASAVADGTRIDWETAESQAGTDEERKLLRGLRLLSDVGDVHETGQADAGTTFTALPPPLRPARAPASTTAQWGRYELREKMGEGSQGAVYRAWDPQLECELALKVMQPHHAAADRVGARILGEGRALARVRHPNVVNVYGVETHEGEIGLCMEFVNGRTLEDIISSDGLLDADGAVSIGVAVCRALAAVHDAGIVHRDVKARNVMRDDKGRVVLMDFGTGQDRTKSARGDLAGTPLYMAPEILFGAPASIQGDIYGVGVLLYHLVTGRYPVEGRTVEALTSAHRSGRVVGLRTRRTDLPDEFLGIVERATAADPAERYDSVSALIEDLSALEAVNEERAAPARTVPQLLVLGAGRLVVVPVVLTVLGFLTSTNLNLALERGDVVSETPLDWLVWGMRSLLGPLYGLAALLIPALVVLVVWRMVRRASATVDAWAARTSKWIALRLRTVRPRDPDTFGQIAFLLLIAYGAFVYVRYSPLIDSVFAPVSQLTPAQRAILSPANEELHNSYRSWLDVLVVASGYAAYRLRRLRRRKPTRLSLALLAALSLTLALATLFWVGPWRLLYQSEFPRFAYRGERCYDLGRKDAEVLFYCPDSPQPKVKRVAESAPGIVDNGVTESVFGDR